MKLLSAIALAVSAAFSLSLSLARTTQAAAPAFDGGVRGIVYAVPFRIEQGFAHAWRREAPQVVGGYLCVLHVDRALVAPRAVAEPVLYAGDTTVERLHHGAESGRAVVVVPTPLDEHGAPALDLARTPFWFGAPALPEQVGALEIAAERRDAAQRGLRPIARDQVAAALARGGTALTFGDRVDLERHAAALILMHAPEDADVAQGMLVPRVK